METELKINPRIGSARTLARRLVKKAGTDQPPISLWKIIKHIQSTSNLSVLPYDFGNKVSGMLVMTDEKATIGYNNEQHWHRRRFTIAHEIGHLLMGHVCSNDPNDHREKEANEFAAELLMPLSILKKDFQQIKVLKTLAEKYTVSEEAMCRHLMYCRLLK